MALAINQLPQLEDMDSVYKRAVLEVDYEVIRAALCLPDDVRITRIIGAVPNSMTGREGTTVQIFLEGAGLPDGCEPTAEHLDRPLTAITHSVYRITRMELKTV